MKKLLTLFCVLLGFGAMASATDPTVDDSGYLDISTTSNEGLCTYEYEEVSKVATITINAPQWTKTNEENADAYASLGATVDLTEEDLDIAGLTKYESSSYTATDGDVFYYWDNGLWKCVGWWLGTFDASAYDKVVVTLSSTSVVNVCVQDNTYNNGPSASSVDSEDDETVVVELGTLTNIDKVSQVYVQNTVANQVITVKSVQFVAEEVVEEVETVYTYNFADASGGIDIASAECLVKSTFGLVSSDAYTNDAIAYFTENSVSKEKGESEYVLELYGAKNGKENGPYAGTVNTTDETPILWTSGKTQGSGEVWYDYFKVNVPADFADQYITISVDYISGSNGSDRYLVVDQTLSDISSEDVVAINSHLASSVSSGQSADNKATTTYYGTIALEGSEAFYLIASNNVGVYSITVTFSDSAPEGTSTTVAVAEPEPTEIEGYLTVAMGSNNLLEDEETTIVVTENTDGTTTVAVPAELSILSMTVTDLSVTFTAGENGAFTDGVASFKLNSEENTVNSIEGTFVTTEDGVTTFESTIAVYGNISIAVSFTTEVPVVEEWTLIVEALDDTCVADLQNDTSTNNTLTVAIADIEGYEYIKIVAQTNENVYTDWGALLLAPNWNTGSKLGDNFAYTDLEGGKEVEEIIAVADILAAIEEGTEEIYFVVWGNVDTAQLYATGEATTESGSGESSGSGEVVEEEAWTLTDHTKVGYDSITWEELEGYDAVKFVLYYDGAAHEGWGMGGIYTFADGTNAAYAWTGTATDPDIWIFTVEDLLEICDPDEAGFAYNTWDPCVKIEVYFGVGEFTTGWAGIADIKADVEVVEVARYNLMGQKISGAEKGINIIVYSDGSAKKVLVK